MPAVVSESCIAILVVAGLLIGFIADGQSGASD